MPHIIIITDRSGNEISVPGPHFAEGEDQGKGEDHEAITVVIDIEKVIDLYNIKTQKDKADEKA